MNWKSELTKNLILAVLFASLAFAFSGCAGNLPPIDQDQVAFGICLATCKNGTCAKVDGIWKCIPNPPKNCSEKKCPDDVLAPEKTACAETQEGPTCYKPFEPKTCPEACPVGQVCTDPAKGCQAIDCRVTTCPAGKHCEAGKGCVPDAIVTPPPPPPPPPATGCGVEGDLVADFGAAPATQVAVRDAIAAIGPRDGHDPQETLRLLGARLNAAGFCTIVGIEAVFVKRPDGRFDEWHAVSFATGGWTNSANGKFIGVHKSDAPPPVSTTCPIAPCPERVWTRETLPDGWGEDAIGMPRWHWNAKLHTMGNCDSTPVQDRNEPFCRAIGLSPYADGTPRAGCPVRPDGHPDRVVVETWLLEGGPVRDSQNGQDCTPNNTDNPFAFLGGTGNCRICNTPKTVCSNWF